MKKNVFLYTVLCLCALVLFAAGVYLLLFAPDEGAYSDAEKRVLSARPEADAASVFSGDYGVKMETYCIDRFPFRDRIIRFTQGVTDSISFASYDDYMRIADEETPEQDALAAIYDSYEAYVAPSGTPAPTLPATPSPSLPPEQTPTPVPTPNAYKMQTSDPAYEGTLAVEMVHTDGTREAMVSVSHYHIRSMARLLDKYAAVLPENGRVIFAYVPTTYKMSRFVAMPDPDRIESAIEPYLNALTGERVIAVPVCKPLGDAVARGEYTYFRADHHWTPWGAYLGTTELAAQTGRTLPAYADYDRTWEPGFLGTIYRYNPLGELLDNPDDLEILSPRYEVTATRMLSAAESKTLPLIDENAPKSDRYCVYLGGPGGPWTVLESRAEGANGTCLVMADSFGVVPALLLTGTYQTVCYTDPTFFDARKMEGNVADLIRRYGITDVYILFSDMHGFKADYTELLVRQFGQ